MIAIEYGLTGPNFGVVSECATATHSLGESLRIIQHGEADDMVPVAGALRLYEAARPFYEEHPDHLKLMLYPHTHLVSEQEMHDAVHWVATMFAPAE